LWIVETLFLDSLLYLRVLPPQLQAVMDLGAGAGLPGLPIKIVRSEIRLTLVEPLQHRVSFLSTAIRELGLSEARVVNARAEDLGEEFLAAFDAVVMRCVARPDAALRLAGRFVAPGGVAVVSGPPREHALRQGRWVTVPGITSGKVRRFALLSRPNP
jgi:16S rRNA (guanine527-N7)-methyltransferase